MRILWDCGFRIARGRAVFGAVRSDGAGGGTGRPTINTNTDYRNSCGIGGSDFVYDTS